MLSQHSPEQAWTLAYCDNFCNSIARRLLVQPEQMHSQQIRRQELASWMRLYFDCRPATEFILKKGNIKHMLMTWIG